MKAMKAMICQQPNRHQVDRPNGSRRQNPRKLSMLVVLISHSIRWQQVDDIGDRRPGFLFSSRFSTSPGLVQSVHFLESSATKVPYQLDPLRVPLTLITSRQQTSTARKRRTNVFVIPFCNSASLHSQIV